MKGTVTKPMTIRVPVELWKKVRMLQTEGKVKSFQDAAVRGLFWIVNLKRK